MIGIYSGIGFFFIIIRIPCKDFAVFRHCLPERLTRGEEVNIRLKETNEIIDFDFLRFFISLL
jgi:hypothetical protein